MRLLIVSAITALLCAAQPSRFAHTSGKDIVAPDGTRLLLKGINLGNWLVPEGYMFRFDKGPQSAREIDALFQELIGPEETRRFWTEWRENYITERDIEFIRSVGFNSVRVPLHWALFRDERSEGFALLDRLIRQCRAGKLWVILDLHAAPGGQTGTNIDDSWGWPWLFESEEAQQETVALWERIARRYRDEPQVLGYELLNEPIPHFDAVRRYNERLEPLYKRIVEAIRRVDREHMVILGGSQWNSNFKVFGAPFAANLVYTFHKYWTAPTAEVIREYTEFRDRHNVPLFMGESGENTDEWIAQFRETLDAHGIGWTFWPYKKMDATSSAVSFARPQHWDAIVEYGKLGGGTGEAEQRIKVRPTLEQSREALKDLLTRIRFENCRVNDGFLKALGGSLTGMVPPTVGAGR